MDLEEIHTAWDQDKVVDKSELADESCSITPRLHHKYYRWYLAERKVLRGVEKRYLKLRLDKKTFLLQGPSKDDPRHRDWKLPPGGRVLKAEVDDHLTVDPDLMILEEELEQQKEKVDFLKVICEKINKRSFDIKNSIEFLKWTNGS